MIRGMWTPQHPPGTSRGAEAPPLHRIKDLVVGSGISFADRGTHSLKGIPDEWPLVAATDV
jgi:hypothetical protein